MSEQKRNIFKSGIWADRIELRKFLILGLAFFLVIGGHTLLKELKDFVFFSIVGKDDWNIAKLMSVFVLIPLVFIYSRVVDLVRRHQLICIYAIVYGLGGLICAYFLGHPEIGLANTTASSNRIFGWVFFYFIEGYQPFVVSLLWAFVNSLTKAEDVKDGYMMITASSKVGGAITGFLAWFFLSRSYAVCPSASVASYQVVMVTASVMLLIVPIVILYFIRTVPKSHLHGYEAAYQFEKTHEKEMKKRKGLRENIASMLDGFWLFVRYPYMLGIFGMIFFWEITNVVFNYIRLSSGQAEAHNPIQFCASLYQQIYIFHLIGLVLVLLGTRNFIRWFGERKSLIAVPLLIGAGVCYYLAVRTAAAAVIVYMGIRAVNYAFAYPLRESLYIPTTKAMKFKTKSWIDGIGAKIAKAAGSTYNIGVGALAGSMVFSVHIAFFAGIVGLWALVANFLGRQYEQAVEQNKVIGVDEI